MADLTMEEAKKFPVSKKIAAGTLTLLRQIDFWTVAGSAYPSTWYGGMQYRTTAVAEDGVALTERASVALVDANPGSWYWAYAEDRLYVSPSDSSPDPYAVQVLATITLYIATHPKRFAGIAPHLSRIKSGPPIKMDVEEDFGKVGRIGGGTLRLTNADGYFDAFLEMEFDGGLTTLLIGIDRV